MRRRSVCFGSPEIECSKVRKLKETGTYKPSLTRPFIDLLNSSVVVEVL